MTRVVLLLFAAVLAALRPGPAAAVATVNPNGVNVRTHGPTTVFLSFQSLDPSERPVDAFWCGAVQPGVAGGAVTATDPCMPGSLYGRLPLRHDLARLSRSGAATNLTDIMTIPATVARRAYQDAAAGQASDFFYVRRFAGGPQGERFVVVTCRLSAAGARSPLALLDVRLGFEGQAKGTVLPVVARGAELPRYAAHILYNGSGELRGRWELVQPGDQPPADDDLLTEATLPVEQRAGQRRYRLLGRFQAQLLPGGELTLPGPDTRAMRLESDGPYQILLRVEASDDKEGQSQIGGGRVVASGGVAGFALPVLRFFVGAEATLSTLTRRDPLHVELLSPGVAESLPAAGAALFTWIDADGAALHRLEIESDRRPVLEAYVKPLVGQYRAPGGLVAGGTTGWRWRVVALDAQGIPIGQSGWRSLAAR